jgi:PAS domain S-box-containing protein
MSLVVRVVAPTGRDAELIVAVLHKEAIAAELCPDPTAFFNSRQTEPIGPLLVTEESLTPNVVRCLSDAVREQPAWSDLPILILTTGGRETLRSRQLEKERHTLGSAVLLERPIRTSTLISSVQAALRARQRQYEVRDVFLERDRVLDELRIDRDILRTSEERFRRLIESAPIGFNISDINGHISYANPTLLSLIGYTAEDVAAGLVRWDELTPPEFTDVDRRAKARLQATGTCDPYQKAYIARDGHLVPFLVGSTMIPASSNDGKGNQIAVFLTDLTSQKKTESALMQSEKLAAVGRLAASISHEINNPLESVTNLLYLIAQDADLPRQARTYLSIAEGEIARVSQIASQTLRFHRQSTKASDITPEALIESVVGVYQGRLHNSSIQVVRQHRIAASITCYEGEIRQVLHNLVGNAIDSMRTGGRLILRTQNATSWRTGQQGIRITVADTGYGMSPEVLSRVFEAFFTTKGDNGTGLGLWISRGIIDKHHGHLEVSSTDRTPRNGTVFSLFLPRNLPPAA